MESISGLEVLSQRADEELAGPTDISAGTKPNNN